MSFEATFQADSAVGRWSAVVPVADDEQQHVRATEEHRGVLFLTTKLAVFPRWSGQGLQVVYVLSGPNIRQDGTPGVRTLRCQVTREDAEKAYPGALALALVMLADGAERVISAANRARDELAQVIDGGSRLRRTDE